MKRYKAWRCVCTPRSNLTWPCFMAQTPSSQSCIMQKIDNHLVSYLHLLCRTFGSLFWQSEQINNHFFFVLGLSHRSCCLWPGNWSWRIILRDFSIAKKPPWKRSRAARGAVSEEWWDLVPGFEGPGGSTTQQTLLLHSVVSVVNFV